MKRSLILKGLVAILLLFVMCMAVVGCVNPNENQGNNGESGNNEVTVDKTALQAELALEVTEQGDYTADSYKAYLEKLNAAKAISDSEEVTQISVDTAAAELTKARNALEIRPVEPVKGANKDINLVLIMNCK